MVKPKVRMEESWNVCSPVGFSGCGKGLAGTVAESTMMNGSSSSRIDNWLWVVYGVVWW